ncbi:hypothetical protein [Maricaulis sp.]|uniref:hypothetical protein n=1 Tax=Maricaulis sp. TaxID=1486257 RepID=UPI003A927339
MKRLFYLIVEAARSLALFYGLAFLVALVLGVLFGNPISIIVLAGEALVATVIFCVLTLYLPLQFTLRTLGVTSRAVLLILPLGLVVSLVVGLIGYAWITQVPINAEAWHAYLRWTTTVILFLPLNYRIVLNRTARVTPSDRLD